jgi:hypothetical protein
MQKTKGNLAFAEKYKLVQWLEQNLASLGGRTYESIAQEATAEPQLPYEQLVEEHKQLTDRVRKLENQLSDLLSVKRSFLDHINPNIYPGPYSPRTGVTCADPSIKSMFKGDESSHDQAAIPIQ